MYNPMRESDLSPTFESPIRQSACDDLLARIRDVPSHETTQHIKNLHIYGYTHVRQFMSQDLTEFLLAQIRKLAELPKPTYLRELAAGREKDGWVYNPQNKGKFFIDILDYEFLRKILIEKLNDKFHRNIPPELPNYILGFYVARSSGDYLDLHLDSYDPFPGETTFSMHVSFVLEDQTAENGCMFVVPGSHRIPEFTDRELKQRTLLTPKAGDLVLWDSRLWHGTMANTSGGTRWSLIVNFRRYWVKPVMDVTRSLPDEIYQHLTDEQKQLLGFCAIPPKDENAGSSLKAGHEALLSSVDDYYR